MISVRELWTAFLAYCRQVRRGNRRAIAIGIVVLTTLTLGAIQGPHGYFVDEHDNILGAKVLLDGDIIYKDYFSHHMPLAYFTTAPLYALTGNSLISLKVLFGFAVAIWVLIMSRHLLRAYGVRAWAAFCLLFAGSIGLTYANMILAETLVALAATHLFILFATRRTKPFGLGMAATYSILAAIPFLSSAAYVWVSIIGYVLGLIHAYPWLTASRTGKAMGMRFVTLAGIASAPYVLFFAYLYGTGSLSPFIADAFTFNTEYYSRFASEISKDGYLVTIITQASVISNSLYDTLLNARLSSPMPVALVIVAIFLLWQAFLHKTARLTALAGAGILLAGSVRSGFANTFLGTANARAGTVIACVGLGFIIAIWYELRRTRPAANTMPATTFLVGAFCTLLALGSLASVTTALRDYTSRTNMIIRNQPPTAPATIINLVNTDADARYWVGPLDFYSQLFIGSQNASVHRFYLPWHSACSGCTTELITDLKVNNTRVIYWNKDVDIWGYRAADYGQSIQAHLAKTYYQVADPRLEHYYFNKADRVDINQKISEAGYEL